MKKRTALARGHGRLTRPTKPLKAGSKANTTYTQRNLLLRELGYDSYYSYLLSPLWYAIRRRAYRIHGYTCKLCPRPATTIHHLSYNCTTLLGKDLTYLAPLCKICHRKVEFTPGDHKRKLSSAQRVYKTMLTRRTVQRKLLAAQRKV